MWYKPNPSTAALRGWSREAGARVYWEDPGNANNLGIIDIDVDGGYMGRKVDDGLQQLDEVIGWKLYRTADCATYPSTMEGGRVAWGVTRKVPYDGISLRSWGRGFIVGTPAPDEFADPHFCLDASGRVWMTCTCAGAVRVYHRDSPQRDWERHGDAFTGAFTDPEIACLGTGEMLVVATPKGATSSQVMRSGDGGATWAVVT
jgi:hypothetical protein